jgi:hypothetical protein
MDRKSPPVQRNQEDEKSIQIEVEKLLFEIA